MRRSISRWRAAPALVVLTVVSMPGARATELLVGPSETLKTIQAAIDGALDGDSVKVRAGLYKEAIDFKGKKIQVRSELGAAATTIDATGIPKTAVASFKTLETAESVLDGFTLTGGSGAPLNMQGTLLGGGGVFVDKCTPTIRNCEITGNTVLTKGGGILVQGIAAGGLIENCTISGNQSKVVSGASGGGIAVVFAGTGADVLTIKDCKFENNKAPVAGGAFGGGAYLGGANAKAKVVLQNCNFTDNLVGSATSSGGDGGGLYLDTIIVEMHGGEVSNNQCLRGGGIAARAQGVSSLLDGVVIKSNTALSAGSGGGGGIFIPDATTCRMTISKCEISENNSGSSGGGGMWVYSGSPIIDSCKFISNTTTESGGAIRYVATGTKTKVNATVFQKNHAANEGGAVYVSSSSSIAVTYTNCLFVKNDSTNGGGAIYNKAPSAASSVKFLFCTFFGNKAGPGGSGGMQHDAAGGQALVSDCIFWGNTPIDYASDGLSAGKISYSAVENPTNFAAARNVFKDDPLFVDAAADPPDLHLTKASPYLDKGDPKLDVEAPTADFDGKDRLADSDDDGTPRVDLGAYEVVLVAVPKPKFVRGPCRHPDAVLDGAVIDIGDPIYLLRWRFLSLYPEPGCLKACDANDDGKADLTDAVYLLNWLFVASGQGPKPPYPAMDVDPTLDALTCVKGKIE